MKTPNHDEKAEPIAALARALSDRPGYTREISDWLVINMVVLLVASSIVVLRG